MRPWTCLKLVRIGRDQSRPYNHPYFVGEGDRKGPRLPHPTQHRPRPYNDDEKSLSRTSIKQFSRKKRGILEV